MLFYCFDADTVLSVCRLNSRVQLYHYYIVVFVLHIYLFTLMK
jgi:hypothetical protein